MVRWGRSGAQLLGGQLADIWGIKLQKRSLITQVEKVPGSCGRNGNRHMESRGQQTPQQANRWMRIMIARRRMEVRTLAARTSRQGRMPTTSTATRGTGTSLGGRKGVGQNQNRRPNHRNQVSPRRHLRQHRSRMLQVQRIRKTRTHQTREVSNRYEEQNTPSR